jgi:hypothetical protein
MAWVRALIAVARATRSEQSISTVAVPAWAGWWRCRPARCGRRPRRPAGRTCRGGGGPAGRAGCPRTRPALGGKEASERGAVAAGALHTPGVDLAQPPGPGEQVLVAGGGGRMLTVSRQRPSWSLAWATWRSRWVSTPTVTRGRSGWAMVVIAVSLLRSGGGRHAPAGRADSTATGLAPQARRSRSPGWWHRWRPQRESTGLARGTRPVEQRVRRSPRPPPPHHCSGTRSNTGCAPRSAATGAAAR